MSFDALVLAIIAAFAHAAWNIIAHGSSRSGLPFLTCGAIVSAVLWLPAVPLTGGLGPGRWRGVLIGASVSAMLHVGYMVLLQRGYALGDLSTVYATARGTGPILTVIIAILLLGERPSPLTIVGVTVVTAGVVAMGLIGRNPVRRMQGAQGVGAPAALRGAHPAVVHSGAGRGHDCACLARRARARDERRAREPGRRVHRQRAATGAARARLGGRRRWGGAAQRVTYGDRSVTSGRGEDHQVYDTPSPRR